MSNTAIKSAFEQKLLQLMPALPTDFENLEFEPVDGEPYQVVNILFARPENPTFGDNFYRQRGYVQIDLHYPVGNGGGDADARGELLQAWFFRGLSVTANGVTATVEETPEIGNGQKRDGRFVVPVRIRFFANIQH